MKTYLDCIPCFFRQLLDLTDNSSSSTGVLRIVRTLSLPNISLGFSPPEIACIAYNILNNASANKDPYKDIKQKSNRMALGMFKKLKDRVAHSSDKLLAALALVIAGNIIDFGVKNNLDVKAELKRILREEHKTRPSTKNLYSITRNSRRP